MILAILKPPCWVNLKTMPGGQKLCCHHRAPPWPSRKETIPWGRWWGGLLLTPRHGTICWDHICYSGVGGVWYEGEGITLIGSRPGRQVSPPSSASRRYQRSVAWRMFLKHEALCRSYNARRAASITYYIQGMLLLWSEICVQWYTD